MSGDGKWMEAEDLEQRGLGEKRKQADFPKPRHLGPKVVWLLRDVLRWEAEHAAPRPDGQP